MASGNSQWFSAPASQTIYGQSAARDESIRRHLIDQFTGAGYSLISLPALIQHRTTNDKVHGDDYATMELRTDTTVQVATARAKAKPSALDNFPEKLSYAEKVITKFPKHPLVSREYTQMGIENFATDAAASLLSVMTLLKDIFQNNPETLFEVALVHPINNLLAQISDERLKDSLASSLSMKAEHQIQAMIADLHVDQQEAAHLLLASHFDLREVKSLDQINRLLSRLQQLSMISPACVISGLQSIEMVTSLMSNSKHQVNFDLSIPTVDSYYSGIMFNVYHPSLPFALVTGGQYNLLGLDGVGFTVRTDLLREINFIT